MAIGIIVRLTFNGINLFFAGLVILALGIWQLLSTIMNLLNKGVTQKYLFFVYLIIAGLYVIIALLVALVLHKHITSRMERMLLYLIFGTPPIWTVKYWVCIGKMYQADFFKNKKHATAI